MSLWPSLSVSPHPWCRVIVAPEHCAVRVGETSMAAHREGLWVFDLPAKGEEAIPILGTFRTINLSPVLRD